MRANSGDMKLLKNIIFGKKPPGKPAYPPVIMNRRKIRNQALVALQRRMGRRRVFGFPYEIIVDPCNFCNLKCPMCPSVYWKGEYKPSLLSFDLYKKIIDYFGPYLWKLYLYNYGEPLLNPEIYNMVEYARRYHPEILIATNLNIGDPERIVRSQLDWLLVSIDGATNETYKKYRVGGDLNIVLDKVRHIISERKRLNTDKPRLAWQYLVFEHNKDEVEQAEELSKEMGFDAFNSSPGQVFADHPLIKPWSDGSEEGGCTPQPIESLPDNNVQKACWWLWSSVSIAPNGDIFPCCLLWHPKTSYGNINQLRLEDVFNLPRFIQSRNYFSKGRFNPDHVCEYCNREPCDPTFVHCEICQAYPTSFYTGAKDMEHYLIHGAGLHPLLSKVVAKWY